MEGRHHIYERCYKYRSAKLTVSQHKWRLNKCEAVQEINHMQDANNITLPCYRSLVISAIAYSQLMMCKLRRRHFNKLEAMKARHHMKDTTNITLPS